MTDQTRPDPLGQDYDPGRGSAVPDAPAPGSRMPGTSGIPGTSGMPGALEVPGVPDPSTDQWSAFDEPAPSATPKPPAPAKVPATAPAVPKRPRRGSRNQSGGGGTSRGAAKATPARTATPRPAPTARKKATRTFTAVFLALTLVPIAIGTVISVTKGGSDTGRPSQQRTPVALSPIPVEPTPVSPVPTDVTSLRVEIQGVDRVADIRVYSNGASTSLDSTPLPYAATFPVVNDDAYVSVTVDDYGYRGPIPMRCTIYAGDVVLTTAVGIRRLECQVSDKTWQGR